MFLYNRQSGINTHTHTYICRLPSSLCRIWWDMIGWPSRGLWDWDYNPQISVCRWVYMCVCVCNLRPNNKDYYLHSSECLLTAIWLRLLAADRPSEKTLNYRDLLVTQCGRVCVCVRIRVCVAIKTLDVDIRSTPFIQSIWRYSPTKPKTNSRKARPEKIDLTWKARGWLWHHFLLNVPTHQTFNTCATQLMEEETRDKRVGRQNVSAGTSLTGDITAMAQMQKQNLIPKNENLETTFAFHYLSADT